MSAARGTGRFITLEGGEGAGKSTQAGLIAAALRSRGVAVVSTREPGGTAGAEAIRTLLMTGATDRWSAASEALLFAAARADHVERVIRPALDRGDWVVCDRFIDSTRAYQGGAGGIDDADIMALHRIGSGGLMPDRTLLLALASEAGIARAARRDGPAGDRFAARDAAYAARLAARFTALASADPGRFRVIDAAGDPEKVSARAMANLADLL